MHVKTKTLWKTQRGLICFKVQLIPSKREGSSKCYKQVVTFTCKYWGLNVRRLGGGYAAVWGRINWMELIFIN